MDSDKPTWRWREHRFRIIYVLVSIGLLALALYWRDEIVTDKTPFNFVSYAGTVATLIALIVTIFEVIHSASISRAIRDEAAEMLDRVRSLDRATLLAECITSIDDITKLVSNEKYSESLALFQSFRKTFVHARVAGLATTNTKEDLSVLEMHFVDATATTPVAPYSIPQRKHLHRRLLKLKSELETANTNPK
ncbi:hypothetical protein [Achromobacter xylosoxidans]|uniref:hypothetical protein n=1 Tax=Alcaligenes xylosoxydans xylosoxydans TaxID=85698 RepID=UPI0012DD8A7E|nr:hypothetical protein [Achromobacter xylosoxidans]